MRSKSQALAPFGLTVPQYAALLVIAEHPGLSAADLARRYLVARQTITTVLKNLVDKGARRSTASPVDRPCAGDPPHHSGPGAARRGGRGGRSRGEPARERAQRDGEEAAPPHARALHHRPRRGLTPSAVTCRRSRPLREMACPATADAPTTRCIRDRANGALLKGELPTFGASFSTDYEPQWSPS